MTDMDVLDAVQRIRIVHGDTVFQLRLPGILGIGYDLERSLSVEITVLVQ